MTTLPPGGARLPPTVPEATRECLEALLESNPYLMLNPKMLELLADVFMMGHTAARNAIADIAVLRRDGVLDAAKTTELMRAWTKSCQADSLEWFKPRSLHAIATGVPMYVVK